MLTKVVMPQVGQDLEVGRIVRWLRKQGDSVKKGEALCEVETEKAVVEVPSPVDGTLVKVLYPDEAEVKILTEIAFIGDPFEAAGIERSAAPTAVKSAPVAVGSNAIASAPVSTSGMELRISPKAKAVARELNVPIDMLAGTGPQGRIVEKDVRDYVEKHAATHSAQSSRNAATPVLSDRLVEQNKIHKVTAQRLQQSKQTIPHFYISLSVDMTGAMTRRRELNDQYHLPKEESISLNDLVIKSCALALQDFPMLNSSYTEKGIQLWGNIDIGIAVALDEGLVVPVVEDCQQRDLKTLSTAVRMAVQAARTGKQLMTRPGRFTISNLGMFHVDDFSAIINPPEVGILAVGAVKKQLVVQDDGSFSVRDLMKATLSVDHRVVDGALAAKFLNRIKEYLESPQKL